MTRTHPGIDDLVSDYNIFGYDPEGRLAHIVAHFFGPAWQPQSFTHLPCFGGKDLAPPRYGYPAPEQIPHLPEGFVPCLPPYYHGIPRPPYLQGPRKFDPGVFAALLVLRQADTKESERLLSGLPIGEVAYNRKSQKDADAGSHLDL
jgi:hypothetical protein